MSPHSRQRYVADDAFPGEFSGEGADASVFNALREQNDKLASELRNLNKKYSLQKKDNQNLLTDIRKMEKEMYDMQR